MISPSLITPTPFHLNRATSAFSLIEARGPESRGGGIGKEAARVREFDVARLQFRHGLPHGFGIFDFEGDEAVAALEIRVADQRVEGGVVAGEFRIAPPANVRKGAEARCR
jgi:hypothetical protein